MLETLESEAPNLTFKLLGGLPESQKWIQLFGDQISSVFLLRADLSPDIATNYTNLRLFSSNSVFQKKTCVLEFWKSVGRTLESINMSFHSDDSDEILQIEKYCRKLRIVHLRALNHTINEAVASCIFILW